MKPHLGSGSFFKCKYLAHETPFCFLRFSFFFNHPGDYYNTITTMHRTFSLRFSLFFISSFPIRTRARAPFPSSFPPLFFPETTSITGQAALLTHVNHKLWFLRFVSVRKSQFSPLVKTLSSTINFVTTSFGPTSSTRKHWPVSVKRTGTIWLREVRYK